jgi:hypothetical protein
MDIMKLSEKVMSMDDESWDRHSNPWSVYTRFTTLPLISLAFWSREWLDFYALIPITLSFFWVWVNPRLFSAPKNTNNWASMGTFGERIYLNRKKEPIPVHQLKFCRILLVFSGLGLPFFFYGIYTLDLWVLVLGNLWVIAFKAWFVDRMVWLYSEMKNTSSATHSS